MPVPRGQRPYCTVAFPLNDSQPRLRAHSNLIPCDGSPYPSCMHSFSDLRGLPAVPASSGWVQRGERWDLWWSGRIVASIVPHAVLGFQVYLDARRMSPAKVVHAVNARQARRYAERWCAARLCPPVAAARRGRLSCGRRAFGRRGAAAAAHTGAAPAGAPPGRGRDRGGGTHQAGARTAAACQALGAVNVSGVVGTRQDGHSPGKRYAESSSRTILAPSLSARSLPLATVRASGAMPQLVLG